MNAPLFSPRPYQREAIEAVRLGMLRGVRRPLVVLPTGAGKTVVFSHLARRRAATGRTLVIAHREELLHQAAGKLQQIAPDLRVGIVKAERDEHADVDVVVASVQTICRPKRLNPLVGQFATVVVDEAHHAVADTYRTVLEGLGAFDDGGPLTVGVTATAGERTDGIGLDQVWQEIVYSRGILYMISQGYLVDVEALEVVTDLDYDKVTTRAGDFTDGTLAAAMDDGSVIDAAANAYAKYARHRRGVAFTPTIATAENLAAALTRLGITAEAVSGQTRTDDRQAILRRLSTGETQVVTNCAVLTEGFDEPALSCALIARPTRSRPFFIQMCGRVLRPHPSKDKALILTLQGPPEGGLATIADLAGSDMEVQVNDGESLAEAAARTEAEKAAFGNRRTASILSAKQIDLFARSRLRWLPVGAGFALPVKQGLALLAPQGDGQWLVIEYRRGEFTPIADGLSLEWAQGLGEEQARAAGAIARSDARWRARPPSDNQRATLARMRLPDVETSGEASDAIAVATAQRALRQLAARGVPA